mmetsp:Transcript_35105/g.76666  ORF Transcript_35105/g.76666 Transcript_35105/m.76666 type:complete len:625 (-) Transcript_35105:92-1966(-)
MGTEIMSVAVPNLRRETGDQESDLLDRMPDGEGHADSDTEHVQLVSLGCYCGPKLSFKKIGRGAETLPFDWLRTRLSGVRHFLKNDFDGFYDWTTKQSVPDSKMTIYRGYYHSFWHDNPNDPAMIERYQRRIARFMSIDARTKPVLFVRAACTSDELSEAGELLADLKALFGDSACLLLIVDFQKTAQGAAAVGGHPDLLVYYLSGDAHKEPDGAPYCKPILVALDWMVGRPIEAMQFVDLDTIVDCADETQWGLRGLAGLPAFEDEPLRGREPGAAVLSNESELLENLGGQSAIHDDAVILVSLGCYCGPKLTFQQMGRGAETLPFDWVRVSFDGLLHFISTSFEGFFNYTTQSKVPNSHMTMFRSPLHSFWHDNPDSEEMRTKYKRRITRFESLGESGRPLLFVRAVATCDELLRANELLDLLVKSFGPQACLLLILDWQPKTLGTFVVEHRDDLLVYFLGKEVHEGEKVSAPYSDAVEVAIKWAIGESFTTKSVPNLQSLYAVADKNFPSLANFGGFDAFEPPVLAEEAEEAEEAKELEELEELEPQSELSPESKPLNPAELNSATPESIDLAESNIVSDRELASVRKATADCSGDDKDLNSKRSESCDQGIWKFLGRILG